MTASRTLLIALTAALALATDAAAQSPVIFPAGPVNFTGMRSHGATVLFKPEQGTGPWATVVLLPTCAGVYTLFDWAERLVRVGRMALVLDSYTPRGVTNNCVSDAPVTHRMMADDTAAAWAWLRTLPMVKPDGFAVVGFSWGAMAADKLSVGRLQGRLKPPISGLRAVAAFYPGCGRSEFNLPARVLEEYEWGGDVTTPLMLFLAAKDDETPAHFCVDKANRARGRGQPVSYRLYDNTTHSFDDRRNTSDFKKQLSGNRGTAIYRYNPDSTEASAAQLLTFLAANLD